MLLDLDKFYSSNYKDFVHKEALEQALKYVPEAFLKDVDTKAILSITFSVDDVGENPIYVTYLDKDNKEHIVKLRPNITEQLTEVLKRYPTKVEMSEALEELKATITNEYTIFVNAEVETLNNTINNVNNSLTQSIKDTLDEAKHYTDTKHEEALTAIEEGDAESLATSRDYTDEKNQETQVGLKNYTDTKHEEALTKIVEGDAETLTTSKDYTDSLKDELAPKIAENKNRLYIGSVDGEKTEIEKTGHVTFEVNDGIKAIEVKQNDTEELPAERIDFGDYAKKSDIPTNTVTSDYLAEQLESYETKAEATIDHDKLTTVPIGHKNPFISWYPNIDSAYIRIVKDIDEIKLHINNSETGLETVGYLSRRNPAGFATTGDLEPLANKLSNVWASHKAPFIYWLPNIDINTMKLENAENDVKVTLNDGDVVYWRKSATETPVRVTTQMDTSLNKKVQKDLNFLNESAGNARLIFDNDSSKYYVGKDSRVIHTAIASSQLYPVTTPDLGTMNFKADGATTRGNGVYSYYVNTFNFADPFNTTPSQWDFNTAPIKGDPVSEPTIQDTIQWYEKIGLATGDYVSNCATGCSISEWTVRLIEDKCGVLGWAQKLITGMFTVATNNLNLKPFEPGIDGRTFDELELLFDNTIESWASRYIQLIPAQIKFNFNGRESTFVSCTAKIEFKSLTLDNFDERKMKKICKIADDNNLNGTAGSITIRLNGGY